VKRFPFEVAARFGENLCRCRRRAGISQEEMAYRASIHRTEVSQLERGFRTPRIDTLIKLAASLSASPDELLEGIEWAPGHAVAGGFAVAERPAGGDGEEATGGSPPASAQHPAP
jgi:transcriptional regulator with XRE-family HTH domain